MKQPIFSIPVYVLKKLIMGGKGDFIKLGECWKVIYINKVGYWKVKSYVITL